MYRKKKFPFLNILIVVLALMSILYIIILPPNIASFFPLGLALCFLIFKFFRIMERGKIADIIYKLMIVALCYFIITFSALCISTVVYSFIPPTSNHDAVVVLGAGLNNGDQLSRTLKARLDKTLAIYDNSGKPIIVSGGQGSDELISEAEAMKNYLVENGIDEDLIYMEDKSTSTKQNFLYSEDILDELFEDNYNVLYVSSNFHIFRSFIYMRRADVYGSGVGCNTPWYMMPRDLLREYMAIHSCLILQN